MASRSRRVSSCRGTTSESGDVEGARPGIESVMEVVLRIPRNGVDAAEVFDGLEATRDAEERVAFGDAEEDVVEAFGGGGASQRFDERVRRVIVGGTEVGDVRVIERRARAREL